MIDIKCSHCHKFFAVRLYSLVAGDFRAYCPHCGTYWRITVGFTRLAAGGWRDAEVEAAGEFVAYKLKRKLADTEIAPALAIEALEEIVELDSDGCYTAGELAAGVADRMLRRLGA